jgi:hypothetical protein
MICRHSSVCPVFQAKYCSARDDRPKQRVPNSLLANLGAPMYQQRAAIDENGKSMAFAQSAKTVDA